MEPLLDPRQSHLKVLHQPVCLGLIVLSGVSRDRRAGPTSVVPVTNVVTVDAPADGHSLAHVTVRPRRRTLETPEDRIPHPRRQPLVAVLLRRPPLQCPLGTWGAGSSGTVSRTGTTVDKRTGYV